ncbi:HAD-IA family hydrolase [Deefgea tanakiae]|uniref:HAD-IA family hydrolase n=1 Tax=Deefgea tanakiae TaxID=2865840 RepID=A0ABX8ZCF3_9NEIS|nr:HAD-IA family hydrolase [Deefgea tanakiae]QZA78833.1 HAD-IA family hydrolase [Deefgea tanakiae]
MGTHSAPTLVAKGFLFDMDGTLIDSRTCIELIWRRWSERNDIDFADVMKVMHGRRGQETIAIVAPHLNAELETELLIAEELISLEGTTVLPGALDFLNLLNIEQWALVTSAPRDLALAKLAFVGLPLPKHLICAEDVMQGKPHPAAYLQGAALLGLNANECIAFEDAPNGIRSAHAADTQVIAITCTAGADPTGLALQQVADFSKITLQQQTSTFTLSIAE